MTEADPNCSSRLKSVPGLFLVLFVVLFALVVTVHVSSHWVCQEKINVSVGFSGWSLTSCFCFSVR